MPAPPAFAAISASVKSHDSSASPSSASSWGNSSFKTLAFTVQAAHLILQVAQLPSLYAQQRILHQGEWQNMALPTILHLDVLAAFLLENVLRIDFPCRIETFRLQHFQIGGNDAPSVVERLIGVVLIDQGERLHKPEHLVGHRRLCAGSIDALPAADERRDELSAQSRKRRPGTGAM